MHAHRQSIPAFLSALLVRSLPRNRQRNIKRRLLSASVHPLSTRARLPTFKHTESLGRLLGKSVIPGSVVLLHGELGAGKTSFARGFVRGALNDPSVEVTSPTFLLANEYPVTSNAGEEEFKIFHMDLWRLKDSSSRKIVDFEEVFRNHAALVEWPDRLGHMTPEERLDVFLEYVDVPITEDNPWGFADHDTSADMSSDGRRVTLLPGSKFWQARVQSIANDLQLLEDGKIEEDFPN